MIKPVKLFFAFASDDEQGASSFMRRFRRLERNGDVETMHHNKIPVGENETELEAVKRYIRDTHILILLLSADFLNSDRWFDLEETVRVERAAGTKVIPVILRDCEWRDEMFGGAVTLPRSGQAMLSAEGGRRDEVFTEVEKEVKAVIAVVAKEKPTDKPSKPPVTATDATSHTPTVNNSFKKILFLASNPTSTGRLRLDKEYREITASLERANYRAQFDLESKWAVRPRDLSRAVLDYSPQIIHFSGHGLGDGGQGGRDYHKAGTNDEQSGDDGGIVLEDDNGKPKVVSGQALANLLSLFADSIQCVVLNSCYSQDQAEALVQHIPYVIGMNQAVPDVTAISFAVGFYDALGAGASIEFAFNFALASIDMEGIGGEHIPVLLKK